MKNYTQKFLGLTIILLTSFIPIFGLSRNEINKATAYLGTRGYGIRKKLMEENNLTDTIANNSIYQDHSNISQTNSDINNDVTKLANQILEVSKKSSVNNPMQHKFLVGSITTCMATIPLLRQKQAPNIRFDAATASASIEFLTAAISPVMTLLGMSFLIWKIEHFINGPALAKIITEESERKQDITRVFKEMATQQKAIDAIIKNLEKKYEEKYIELERLVKTTHETTNENLKIVTTKLQETLPLISETKEVNKNIQNLTKNKILPTIQKMNVQVENINNKNNKTVSLCCGSNTNDVIPPSQKKIRSRSFDSSIVDDEKEN